MRLEKRFLSVSAGILAIAAVSFGSPAYSHFQMIYTPDVVLEKPAELPFKLVFTHPFANGHTMDMGEPVDFFYVHKGKRTDLKPLLKPLTWKGAENEGKAYEASVKIKRNGDYIFVVHPSPYYEESEDIYIQQITKSFVNKGGIPTDWSEAVGLPTEIVPLNKPYNVFAGSTFSGVLLSEGEPVPGAEIEIEYVAAEPNMEANAFPPQSTVRAPESAVVAVTDASGGFTFGLPKAGFWGFAALDVGPAKEHDGKKLSQDAVIWVHAKDLQ